MTNLKLWMILLLAVLPSCDSTTGPFQLQLQVFDRYAVTAEGCEVSFEAAAFGNGRADWDQFIHLRGQTVLAIYSGVEFWGADRIEAGQQQPSISLALRDGAEAYSVQMEFRTGRTNHILTFLPVCPVA